MSWQDEAIERRRQAANEAARRKQIQDRLAEISRRPVKNFFDRLIEANNGLDPSLRLSINHLWKNDGNTCNLGSVVSGMFNMDVGNDGVKLRFSGDDQKLYLMVKEDVHEKRDASSWVIFDKPPLKHHNDHYYLIDDSNITHFIDLILRNICTNRPFNAGFPKPHMTKKRSAGSLM